MQLHIYSVQTRTLNSITLNTFFGEGKVVRDRQRYQLDIHIARLPVYRQLDILLSVTEWLEWKKLQAVKMTVLSKKKTLFMYIVQSQV